VCSSLLPQGIQFYTSLPSLVQIGVLYYMADIGTIGSKSTFDMKNFFVSQDILTILTYCVFNTVLYIYTTVGANRTTMSYSCHRNDRFEISI